MRTSDQAIDARQLLQHDLRRCWRPVGLTDSLDVRGDGQKVALSPSAPASTDEIKYAAAMSSGNVCDATDSAVHPESACPPPSQAPIAESSASATFSGVVFGVNTDSCPAFPRCCPVRGVECASGDRKVVCGSMRATKEADEKLLILSCAYPLSSCRRWSCTLIAAASTPATTPDTASSIDVERSGVAMLMTPSSRRQFGMLTGQAFSSPCCNSTADLGSTNMYRIRRAVDGGKQRCSVDRIAIGDAGERGVRDTPFSASGLVGAGHVSK